VLAEIFELEPPLAERIYPRVVAKLDAPLQVRVFAQAILDDSPAYQGDGAPVPPTFPALRSHGRPPRLARSAVPGPPRTRRAPGSEHHPEGVGV